MRTDTLFKVLNAVVSFQRLATPPQWRTLGAHNFLGPESRFRLSRLYACDDSKQIKRIERSCQVLRRELSAKPLAPKSHADASTSCGNAVFCRSTYSSHGQMQRVHQIWMRSRTFGRCSCMSHTVHSTGRAAVGNERMIDFNQDSSVFIISIFCPISCLQAVFFI
jgi:hypothetical protein